MNQNWSCNIGENEKGKASVSRVLKYGNGSEGDQLIGDNTCISDYSVFTVQIFCNGNQCVGVFIRFAHA